MHATEVRKGQVWADNDWRCEGRTLRVLDVSDGRATCEILTDSTSYPPFRSQVGKTTKIKVGRFTPNSTGYRLVSDAAEAQP